MSTRIHPQARTTPKIRHEIKASGLTAHEAARVFNITKATAAKWLKRDDVQDRSHRAHTLHTMLSAAQEAIVLSLRQTLYLPLDDLLYITRQYINPDVSRSGIARLLKREGMARLEDVIPAAEGETIQAKKTFKDYEPGFVHIDIKYLPQMPDETSRRYLFVAIDRATRWVFLHIYHDMSDTSSIDFLRRLKEASPIKISKILTDNGSQFTDRFSNKEKKPSGRHVFDKVCAGMGIEHRLAPPRHPQTNGMVERFNGRISELLQQTRFDSQADLEKTLHNYLKLYNHHIPQRAIGSKTPIQALKEWQRQKPELFVKRVYEQTGLDNYPQALLDLDRGYDTNHKLTPSNDHGVGIAMSPRVMRDNKLKTHIVICAETFFALLKAKRSDMAINTVAHECAHVELNHLYDAAFPGTMLRMKANALDSFRTDCMLACWDEFAACWRSAHFGPSSLLAYEAAFLPALEETRQAANAAIMDYRTHGDIVTVMNKVCKLYGNLLKYSSYHLGNLHGHGIDWHTVPTTADALQDHWFLPFFKRLDSACKALAADFGNWTNSAPFDVLRDIAEDLVADGGMYFGRHEDDRISLDIPMTIETMPVPPHLWR